MKIESNVERGETTYFITMTLSESEALDLMDKIGILPLPSTPTRVITELYDELKRLGLDSPGLYPYYCKRNESTFK